VLGVPAVAVNELPEQVHHGFSVREKYSSQKATTDQSIVLTKPFGAPELLARIRVALRRAVVPDDGVPTPVFTSGELRVDLVRREVLRAGEPVHLTPTEYKLLAALIRQAGKVATHRQLLHAVWGPNHAEDTHYLRVYMGQLRKKIEADPAQPRHLVTETGIGYRFVP